MLLSFFFLFKYLLALLATFFRTFSFESRPVPSNITTGSFKEAATGCFPLKFLFFSASLSLFSFFLFFSFFFFLSSFRPSWTTLLPSCPPESQEFPGPMHPLSSSALPTRLPRLFRGPIRPGGWSSNPPPFFRGSTSLLLAHECTCRLSLLLHILRGSNAPPVAGGGRPNKPSTALPTWSP